MVFGVGIFGVVPVTFEVIPVRMKGKAVLVGWSAEFLSYSLFSTFGTA
ncbi:MAG: hypothetical protein ACFFDT_25320 [Candidatus Hodarchaeota archaeon]